jgi:hypothetical protein
LEWHHAAARKEQVFKRNSWYVLPAQRDEKEVVGREVGGTCDDRKYVDEAAEAKARLAPIVDAAARGRNV